MAVDKLEPLVLPGLVASEANNRIRLRHLVGSNQPAACSARNLVEPLRLVVLKPQPPALVGVDYLAKNQQRQVFSEARPQVLLKQAVVCLVLLGSPASAEHKILDRDSEVEACLVVMHNSNQSQPLDSHLVEQTQLAGLGEVEPDLEPAVPLILPEAAYSAQTQQHRHLGGSSSSSSKRQHLIHSVPLGQLSRTRTSHPRALRLAVSVGNNKNRADSLAAIIQRRITQGVVYLIRIHKVTPSNSPRLLDSLGVINLQPTLYLVHQSQQGQALHSSAQARILQIPTPVTFSETWVVITISNLRIILQLGSSDRLFNRRSLGDCSLTLDQRLVVVCLAVARTTTLSSQREALCSGIWGPITSNSNRRASSVTPTMRPRAFLTTQSSSKTPCSLLRR